MRFYTLADKLIKKVQNKINKIGAYENAGEKEYRYFIDELAKSNMPYPAQLAYRQYFITKQDSLNY